MDEKESESGRIFGLGTWGGPFGHERPRVAERSLPRRKPCRGYHIHDMGLDIQCGERVGGGTARLGRPPHPQGWRQLVLALDSPVNPDRSPRGKGRRRHGARLGLPPHPQGRREEGGGGALCCGCSRRRSPRGRRSRHCIYSMRVVLPLVLGI